MKHITKTLALITTGLVVGVVVGRVREKNMHSSFESRIFYNNELTDFLEAFKALTY